MAHRSRRLCSSTLNRMAVIDVMTLMTILFVWGVHGDHETFGNCGGGGSHHAQRLWR